MPLMRGTLDALVLKALSFAPMHGFEITRFIEDGSRGEFAIESAALLQALHRLEADQCLSGDWGVTENNRRARYYTLTAKGRARLRSEVETIKASTVALTRLLDAR
jgi:transcriptional regulator